jgi:hypothetical protein
MSKIDEKIAPNLGDAKIGLENSTNFRRNDVLFQENRITAKKSAICRETVARRRGRGVIFDEKKGPKGAFS